jgi:predicted aminopeptidase
VGPQPGLLVPIRRAGALFVIAALAIGCGDVSYLARVGWSEARILMRRQPIPSLLERPEVQPALRERLTLVLEVRSFAADTLGLSVGDSYSSFAEVDPDATVWVLSAARRDRLEAHTWWYPVVGRVPYRGFFTCGAAEDAGRALSARDLDIDVRTAVAFSTLGWFADPLLSTTAEAEPVELAETVIHELFHSTIYVPGRADFNESAANFAGYRGAAAFFCAGPGDDARRCVEAHERWRAERARAQVLNRLADGLRALYARPAPPAVRERQRTWLTARAADTIVRRRLGRSSELLPPNNARLLAELVYGTELDTFDRLAPTDIDVGPALRSLVREVRDAREPFDALHRLCKLQYPLVALD